MHLDACASGEKVMLVDDLIATGGTALAAIKLLQGAGGADRGGRVRHRPARARRRGSRARNRRAGLHPGRLRRPLRAFAAGGPSP
ncbi:MAG: hypothetical protein WDM92_07805 [Caulobacteraceae bacterium]